MPPHVWYRVNDALELNLRFNIDFFLSFISPLNTLHQQILLAFPSEYIRIQIPVPTSTSTPCTSTTLMTIIVSLVPPMAPWHMDSASSQTNSKTSVRSRYSLRQKSSQKAIAGGVKAKGLTSPARVLCAGPPHPLSPASSCSPCSFWPTSLPPFLESNKSSSAPLWQVLTLPGVFSPGLSGGPTPSIPRSLHSSIFLNGFTPTWNHNRATYTKHS